MFCDIKDAWPQFYTLENDKINHNNDHKNTNKIKYDDNNYIEQNQEKKTNDYLDFQKYPKNFDEMEKNQIINSHGILEQQFQPLNYQKPQNNIHQQYTNQQMSQMSQQMPQQMSQQMSQIPQQMSQMSQQMSQIPQQMSQIPQQMSQIPQQMSQHMYQQMQHNQNPYNFDQNLYHEKHQTLPTIEGYGSPSIPTPLLQSNEKICNNYLLHVSSCEYCRNHILAKFEKHHKKPFIDLTIFDEKMRETITVFIFGLILLLIIGIFCK